MSRNKQETEYLYEIIKKPLVTEKSTSKTTIGQYSFEVSSEANKIDIKKAVELLFPGRTVEKVRTIYMPSKQKRRGSKIGRTQSGKKAIVTIKGEPIEELLGA
ncbi:MAG TPA: 50S ribosomal protein L23 [Candidatus Gastranaerophilales bacterium]|nr:50S ribosomal protein L23 [Candidatus Gastranaerophilales bacterium]